LEDVLMPLLTADPPDDASERGGVRDSCDRRILHRRSRQLADDDQGEAPDNQVPIAGQYYTGYIRFPLQDSIK